MEPVGVAWNVPTSPMIVPFVQVTAALANTVKSDAVAEARVSTDAMADDVVGEDTSLHAAESMAIVPNSPAAILVDASERAGRVER
jgi:hypothetical protein